MLLIAILERQWRRRPLAVKIEELRSEAVLAREAFAACAAPGLAEFAQEIDRVVRR